MLGIDTWAIEMSNTAIRLPKAAAPAATKKASPLNGMVGWFALSADTPLSLMKANRKLRYGDVRKETSGAAHAGRDHDDVW